MNLKNPKIKALLEHYRDISILGKINSVLQWDMNVNLPPNGAEERAIQSAYLTKLISEKWQNKEFKNKVESLSEKDQKLSQEEKGIIRNLKHSSDFYYKVPQAIIIKFSEVTGKAFMVWQKAKLENNFKVFLPHLIKLIDLSKLIAEKLEYKENRYDALLNLYEPGLSTYECKKIFGVLQPRLTELVKKIKESKNYSDKSILTNGQKHYQIEEQKQVANLVLNSMKYDLDSGRMDISSHPFTESLGRYDIRITDRYKETDFRESLMGAMHEAGHALYEQGVNQEYAGTPLDGGVSLGIHESQSRFWENQIGRSYEFSEYLTPLFHSHFPNQLGKIDPKGIYSLLNLVKTSFIRTEADEVTYNLHIALRFEIEEALINERINAKDLPEVWREKMKKYLGVVPDTDREGVLQDVHWSNGMFGYFPTYTLGNLYAAQFTNKMKNKVNIEKCVKKGDMGTILSWLRENIHHYGSLYWPKDLCIRVTGENLNPEYFLQYIEEKYKRIYNL